MTRSKQQPAGVEPPLRSLDTSQVAVAGADLAGMTPAALLEAACAAGLSVSAEEDRIVVRGPRQAERLARQLVARKGELLPIVRSGVASSRPPPPPSQAPAWDHAAADRLLAAARIAIAHAADECQAGRMTVIRRNVVALWLEVSEGYVRDHEMEARRGWDAMALLRSVVGRAVEAAGLKGRILP